MLTVGAQTVIERELAQHDEGISPPDTHGGGDIFACAARILGHVG
jgi:hypothetical protein